jgi:drug/metabolite transporter (DMT)-like permease
LIALAGCILGFVVFSALMKLAGQRGLPPTPSAAINYMIAAVVCAAVSAADAGAYRLPAVWVLGAIAGTIFITGFYIYFAAIARAGLSIAQPTAAMSVLIPTIASVAIWGERPTAVQVVAMAAVCLATLMLSTGSSGRQSGAPAGHARTTSLLLLALFLMQGTSLLPPKVLQELGLGQHRWAYLAVLFGTASVGASGSWVMGRDRISAAGAAIGVGLGLANVAATALMSASLAALPGIVVYPITSVGPMLIGVTLGISVWRERPGMRALAGTLIAVPAVLLLSR